MRHSLLIPVCCLFIFSGPGHALTITATTDIISSSGNINDASTATTGSVSASVLNGAGIGSASATDVGALESSSTGGYSQFFGTIPGSYSLVSDAIWTDTFSNPGTSAQSYQLDFLVPGGFLESSIWASGSHTGEFNSAGYSIDILFDGNTIFSSSGLVTTLFGSAPTSTFGGTSLGGVTTIGGAGQPDIKYAWNTYNGSAFFSVPGNSSGDLTYAMRTETVGMLTQFSVNEFCGPQGTAGGGTCAARAEIANPLGTSVITGITPVSTVPVPAALWLFGSGLLGMIGVAKRRNPV